MEIQKKIHFTTSGLGLSQEGSLRAEKMVNDVNNAALETDRYAFLWCAPPPQQRKKKFFKRVRLSVVICPRTDTLNEKWKTLKFPARSLIRGAYFSCFM